MPGHPRSPFFIVSSGRAGTTLLCALVNAGGKAFVPPESDFVARAFPFFPPHAPLAERDYPVLARLFESTSQTAWRLDPRALQTALEESKPKTLAEANDAACEAYLREHALCELRWGIKRPVLIASIERLRQTYPGCRIIHLVRDGRDVFLSYRAVHTGQGSGFGPSGLITNCLYWIDAVRRLDGVSGEWLLEVRYEDLLADPEEALKQICEFIEVPFEQGDLQQYAATDSNTSFISESHKKFRHKNVGKQIDPTNQRKYRNHLSAFQIWLYEALAAPQLSRYGYELEYEYLASPAFDLLRAPLYRATRIINDMRYARRDRLQYRAAVNAAQGAEA